MFYYLFASLLIMGLVFILSYKFIRFIPVLMNEWHKSIITFHTNSIHTKFINYAFNETLDYYGKIYIQAL